MKTSELTGAALDWAVAKCKGHVIQLLQLRRNHSYDFLIGAGLGLIFRPSTNWADGGPIIEHELCELVKCKSGLIVWWECHSGIEGTKGHAIATGPTLLIAAMRCYVTSKLGDEIEIPKELL